MGRRKRQSAYRGRGCFFSVKKRYQQLSDDDNKRFLKLSESDLKEIDAELDLLEKDGVLNAPEVRINLPSSGEIKAMCLHICHDCNLRCSYCFAKDGTYNTPRDYMSFEVGKAALDFLFANSGKRHNLEVDFFGGEPLMNLDNVKKSWRTARKRRSLWAKISNLL